jgi:hypothetical protein
MHLNVNVQHIHAIKTRGSYPSNHGDHPNKKTTLQEYVSTGKRLVPWLQLSIQKTSQLTGPRGVFQFPQGFGLDLADTLSGDRELLAHFL